MTTDSMNSFIQFMLQALANFFMIEPINYLFGCILLCFLCKAFKILIFCKGR